MAAHIVIDQIEKRFGDVVAVRDFSLEIDKGEFVTLLGPSGCGKTTTLRILGGFEVPGRGRVIFEGRDFTYVPSYRRNIGMVFQNYALFPHRTVWQNVAFGLRMRKLPKQEIAKRVERVLETTELKGLELRRPHQLSGGQQQRVALARSLITQPVLLLMDEPLGALDKKLRVQMQIELKKIVRAAGSTTVYVTHDQEEALSLSDRIVVMRDGAIEQMGAPSAIYETPRTLFVATFVGQANVFHGELREADSENAALDAGGGLQILLRPDSDHFPRRGPVTAILRPEKIRIAAVPLDLPNQVRAKVENLVYLGENVLYELTLDNGMPLQAKSSETQLARSDILHGSVYVGWDPGDVRLVHP